MMTERQAKWGGETVSADSSEAIHAAVRVFISETPDLSKWAQSLDPEDLLQELELVEYSLREGRYIVPPSPLVGLVQRVGMKRKWKKTLKSLRPLLPDHLRSSEREMCAIGLVWCELLVDTCSASAQDGAPLAEAFKLNYSYRAGN